MTGGIRGSETVAGEAGGLPLVRIAISRSAAPEGTVFLSHKTTYTQLILPTSRKAVADIAVIQCLIRRRSSLPLWFGEFDGSRPVVHVSQGTVANARPELIGPAIEGLAGEDVLVVVSTGGRPPEELGLTQVPENVRIASFLPYPELLPRTSVMVTNGGYGGVQIALSHGVPLVVAGTTEDKPEVAARVAWSGAGINLRTSAPTAEMVRNAVRKILAEPSFRFHAKRLAAEYAQYDAVKRGVDAIEKLIGDTQSKLRSA